MGLKEDLAYILPVDPAGPKAKHSGFFDTFSPDIALSYTHSGVVRTWTAKVDEANAKVEWLLKSTVDTGITNPSLASGSTIRKAALVDEDRTHLTIWDTNNAQLEFEEHFAQHDIIQDLDWTSTPDMQSILAVGFPHKVVLLSQLRYDYLDAQPSWTQIREIWIRDLTPHPIGDSCWLTNGHLVIGAGNQLFVYDKDIDIGDRLVSGLRIPSRGLSSVDLFDVVSRLNGPLPVFHPQFLAQCILSGKTSLVHSILINLHKKLKFYTEGDDLDGFLEMPLQDFYEDSDVSQQAASKEMRSSYTDVTVQEEESFVMDENNAAVLNENLARIALPQITSHEQFRLVDTIECVATVEKHRRSMDDNAARYLLFFRQHMLRRSQGVANKDTVSWREIVWAFHSVSQDILTDLVSRQFNGKLTWKAARESGIFMWLSDLTALVSDSVHRYPVLTNLLGRKRNLKLWLGTSMAKPMKEIPLTARSTILHLERKTFFKVYGESLTGIVSKRLRSVYLRITSVKRGGRRLPSRTPTHCLENGDSVSSLSEMINMAIYSSNTFKNMPHHSSCWQTTFAMPQM
jgi:hypothetical protein